MIFGGIFILALGAAAVIASMWPGAEGDLPEQVVAVFPFENRTGDPEMDDVGTMMAYTISTGLDRMDGVEVKASEVLERTQAQRVDATSREIALDLGVGTKVTGSIGALR